MILTIDVGNSNIKVGTCTEDRLANVWRFTTNNYTTVKDFVKLFESCNLPDGIQSVILCSVVPNITGTLIESIKEVFSIEPQEVLTSMVAGINVHYESPNALGVDRFVNAVGAYEIYGGPTIIVDSGTAVKVDVVTEDGSFIGGMICPGFEISFDEMMKRTELLPKLPLKTEAVNVIGRNTVEAMQSGILYGYTGIIENLVKKAKAQLNSKEVTVVGTGGLIEHVMKQTDQIDIQNDFLTLEGLRIINKKLGAI